MKPNEDGPPPALDMIERVEELLAGEPVLAWRPELTRAVVARVRKRRVRERIWLAAAVLLIAAVTAGGAQVVAGERVVSEATGWIADRVPSPPSASAVFESITTSITTSIASLAGGAGADGAAALPLAIVALFLLVALNGAVVARPLAMLRRSR